MSGAITQALGAISGILGATASMAFTNAYQTCPLFLSGGIAGSTPNSVMPITALTQPNILAAIEGGNWQFVVLPGGTLIEQTIGEYPFANQSIAANATIAMPLKVSLEMICPATDVIPYSVKQAIFGSLQSALAQHNQTGGLFMVVTPAFVYENCILKRIVDISTSDTHQRQFLWQWDFEQPLVTLQQAQTAQNNQISKISAGVQTNGQSSGPNVTTNPVQDAGTTLSSGTGIG